MKKKHFTILSIEDNEADFALLKKALEKIPNISLNIINIKNGESALNFIYKKEDYKLSPTPDIIILDINLPTINGKEILKKLKQDENYKVIPIIMFSTSDYFSDIEECYKLYANSYITKTFNIKELFKKIANMGEYWLTSNELPYVNNFCFIDKKLKNKGE